MIIKRLLFVDILNFYGIIKMIRQRRITGYTITVAVAPFKISERG